MVNKGPFLKMVIKIYELSYEKDNKHNDKGHPNIMHCKVLSESNSSDLINVGLIVCLYKIIFKIFKIFLKRFPKTTSKLRRQSWTIFGF